MSDTLTQHKQSEAATQALHYRRPHYNVSENEEAYRIELSLPGVRKDKAHITLEKGELVVTAPRESSTPESWKALRREISTADYKLRLQLNVEIDADKIDAAMSDGVLTLTLPKAEALKTRKIQIN